MERGANSSSYVHPHKRSSGGGFHSKDKDKDMDSARAGSYAAQNKSSQSSSAGPGPGPGVDGIDPSVSFRASNNCGFPMGKDVDIIEGVLEALVRGPVMKLARVMGAIRHLVACSRPMRWMHRPTTPPDVEEAHVMLKKSLSVAESGHHMGGKVQTQVMNLECMKMELLAVLRHLEVRWQLFNEAMTKWCDLEAMLAICTENVTWSGGSGTIISGKNSPLLSEILGSLLSRKLSYNVVIEKVTRLSPKVFPDMCLDKEGNCVELEDSELRNASASLDKLLGSRKNGVYSEDGWYKDQGPYMVLEKGWYTLQDAQGEIVERGSRTVLWKQHNSTWYIRACIVTPSNKKVSLM